MAVPLQWFPQALAKTNPTTHKVLENHQSYLQSKLPRLSGKVKDELSRIVKYDKGEKSKDSGGDGDIAVELADQLNSVPLETLARYVRDESAALNAAKDALQDRRTKGFHRISTKADSFIVQCDHFITAYSGIVGIVKAADMRYGSVASATLSLFFSTVTMKAKDQDAIVSAMEHISDRLPDFGIYQRIYPNVELGGMLADAYRDVIIFMREATSFFERSSVLRSIQSMGKPLQFELMEQRMRSNFSRIRLKCESLLAERVDSLVSELEDMQKRHDRTQIIALRNGLEMGEYRIEKAVDELTDYRKDLWKKFDSDTKRQRLTLDDFISHAAYEYWKSNDSVVLLLSGNNEQGKYMVPQSWLSPIAVDLIQDLLKKQCLVAFEICNEGTTAEIVLTRLVHQLLEKNPTVVRTADGFGEIESQLSKRKSDPLGALMAALLKIVDLQSETVFIVLDRPDLNEGEVADCIQAMIALARDTKGVLKVLVVHRSDTWSFDENIFSIVPKGISSELQRVRLDQRRIR
ncbi:hypothetical protein P280DRAFT_116495 [Massarina eburnea CBS 473.64]|uniref:Uncharacterized protein n=1 Tax=Massarina eburnea CBS 473.64 TaxID=1395130 RepID=A0A6A6SBZ8_9PLEO|nr:hypothetical protein P280DRAFT_116495 [Massarina eburnea CBS 473.64]